MEHALRQHGSPPNSRTAEQHTDPHHNIFAQTCSGPQGKLNTSGCSHDLCAPFPPVTCMIPPSPCESAARFAYISPLLAAYTQTWSKPTSDGRDGHAHAHPTVVCKASTDSVLYSLAQIKPIKDTHVDAVLAPLWQRKGQKHATKIFASRPPQIDIQGGVLTPPRNSFTRQADFFFSATKTSSLLEN